MKMRNNFAALLIILSMTAGGAPAFAQSGQWTPTGRVLLLDSETIAPYWAGYINICHGGVDGPSGSYRDGDLGSVGSCPQDSITGWDTYNFGFGGGGCRPDPDQLGGGFSCTTFSHLINGSFVSTEPLPAACEVLGTYAVDVRSHVNLIYFGGGSMPHDYYEEISDSFNEYVCS